MKLDKELVREILLAVEAAPTDDRGAVVEIAGRDPRAVNYHVEILTEAGLLRAQEIGGLGDESWWYVDRLTYAGHEFLDTVRDGEVWRRTKEGAAKAGGAASS